MFMLRVLCVVVCVSVLVRGQFVPASPCPHMFTYRNDGQQVYGVIRYQPKGDSSRLKLIANFTVKAMLPSSYIGHIEMMGDQRSVLKNFLRGDPLYYRINFPITSPLPEVKAIVVDNDIKCLGQSEMAGPGEYLTTISLDYVLYADSHSGTFPMRHRTNFDSANIRRPSDRYNGVVPTKDGQSFIIKTENFNIEEEVIGPSITIDTITTPNGEQYNQYWKSPDQNLQPATGDIFKNLLEECVRAASSSAKTKARRGISTRTITTCRLGSSTTPFWPEITTPTLQTPSYRYEGQFVPQQGSFVQQQGQRVPQQEPFVPQQGQRGPQQEFFVPQLGQRVPEQESFVPQQGQHVPQQESFVPQQRQPIPQVTFIPQHEPSIPQSVPQQTASTIHASSTVTEECGVVSGAQGGLPLVYYGNSVKRGEWPWLTALYKKRDYVYICAGSLVSKQHVITAAHCIYDKTVIIATSEFVMKVGAFDLDSWNDGVYRGLRASKIHESYDPYTQTNDILLLTLDSPVHYTDYNRPICLWEGDSNAAFIAGHNGIVVSWGQSEIRGGGKGEPRKATLPIVTNEVCRSSRIEFHKLTSENTLCAGDRNGTGPCNGDSGSGLFMFWGGRWRLRGIVSVSLRPTTGEIRCNLNEYVVFTDVAQYLPWIQNNMFR